MSAANDAQLWVSGLIGVGGALLGALVGAFASYRASVALQDRVREARAAIRRKAKLYTPLRKELMRLLAWMEQEATLEEIMTREAFYRTMPQGFFLWEDMKADGRELSIPRTIPNVMHQVEAAITKYNESLWRASETVNRRGAQAIQMIVGPEFEYHAFDTALTEILLERPLPHAKVGLANPELGDQAPRFAAELREFFTTDEEVNQIRPPVLESRRALVDTRSASANSARSRPSAAASKVQLVVCPSSFIPALPSLLCKLGLAQNL